MPLRKGGGAYVYACLFLVARCFCVFDRNYSGVFSVLDDVSETGVVFGALTTSTDE